MISSAAAVVIDGLLFQLGGPNAQADLIVSVRCVLASVCNEMCSPSLHFTQRTSAGAEKMFWH